MYTVFEQVEHGSVVRVQGSTHSQVAESVVRHAGPVDRFSIPPDSFEVLT